MKKVRNIYPFFKKRRFANQADNDKEAILTRSFCMFFRSLWSRVRHPNPMRGWVESHLILPKNSHNRCIITWIGHATFLINIAGVTIITDPVFGNLRGFFKRLAPPGIAIDELPQIDAVLISHNHYDHMDAPSLYALRERNPHMSIFVPYGDRSWFTRRGFEGVSEYSWWESVTVEKYADNVRCTFLPAHHWSQRGVFDRNTSLWGSWMIESSQHRVYFAGDTAYGSHFQTIAQHFNNIDVALMPVAPTSPRPWMVRSHILPEQSVRAFIDLQARHYIPMHWGTFWFGIEPPLDGLYDTYAAWSYYQQQLNECYMHPLRFGQSCYVDTSETQMQYITDKVYIPDITIPSAHDIQDM